MYSGCSSVPRMSFKNRDRLGLIVCRERLDGCRVWIRALFLPARLSEGSICKIIDDFSLLRSWRGGRGERRRWYRQWEGGFDAFWVLFRDAHSIPFRRSRQVHKSFAAPAALPRIFLAPLFRLAPNRSRHRSNNPSTNARLPTAAPSVK